MPSRPSFRSARDGGPGPVEVAVGGVPVLRLIPAERRVRVGLVVPPRDRTVDVSVQPSTACRALEEALGTFVDERSAVDGVLRRAAVTAARRACARTPPDGVSWSHLFGGLAFPLLGSAYELGAAPLAELPRWAVPVFKSQSVGEAATAVFGSSATRPVRRALVGALAPMTDGEIDLSVLALALAGAPGLEPDRLARVLSAERVHQPAQQLPDPSTLSQVRRMVMTWSRDGYDGARLERMLTDAAARPDGVSMLVRAATYADQLGDHGPTPPLPNRLQALYDVHRGLVRSAPDLPARRRRTRRPGVPGRTAEPEPVADERRFGAAAVPAADVERPQHLRLAPSVTLPSVTESSAITATPAARALDGHRIGNLLLALPHTVGDLVRWGRVLSNCLGDFGPAAVAGQAVIFGVHRSNRLVQAVELTPDGRIRQFCGAANRAPNAVLRRTVIGELAVHGLVDVTCPENRAWLSGIGIVGSVAAG